MRTSIAVVLASSLLLAGCGTSFVSTRMAEPVLVARAQSPAEVRAAIIRAMAFRKFSPESEQEGRIMAHLEKGDARLQVAIEYTPTQYAVRYVSSTGLQTETTPSGEVLVEKRWLAWAKLLNSRIAEELQVPARQAAEAARQDREYQLMIEQQHTAQAQADAQAAGAPPPPPSGPTAGQMFGAGSVVLQAVIPTGGINLHAGSYTCCINGAHYTCPSQEALNQCTRSGPSQCTRDVGKSCN
ncbi:MAG: hypothetical protein ABJE95_06055 [Byssovorax sp.]